MKEKCERLLRLLNANENNDGSIVLKRVKEEFPEYKDCSSEEIIEEVSKECGKKLANRLSEALERKKSPKIDGPDM